MHRTGVIGHHKTGAATEFRELNNTETIRRVASPGGPRQPFVNALVVICADPNRTDVLVA